MCTKQPTLRQFKNRKIILKNLANFRTLTIKKWSRKNNFLYKVHTFVLCHLFIHIGDKVVHPNLTHPG